MKDEMILPLLEEAAEKLSIKIHYDDLRKGEINTSGGTCVLKGEKRIIIHKKLHTREKVDVLMELLSEMDFESIHLPTEIREKLDKIKDRQQPAGVSVEPH
ncbi:MAG: hypothetical protein A3G39_04270 [Deltaproteobacteria bacterium RIFCSPLOWO2_12_FULL_43_16]|nr:MAG: hypothetical protein A2Z89_05700 [Deltaproteobacteria bacterium GWA2_43_19]OGQ10140.1 MAG: hypothetical protein A3D30_09165 [Deltaproteobacteria bacterium RIFCSPHIGHO2_02_FULL_43_33]OGQ35758.1 MAG: hypothetical protein A3A85_07270 [Deltaproteobacteria bacterium RIFCSPLOWO2_01_FULL_42_9]OGQ58805.1 MAG: hypothetical protein A3G39_04270 [Deltaproteobacteria bacterium RIFCSPLOWO2_12_FULL_43_16]HBR17378.1 hypothetical protein [Deltaproteobacteria bacterium]